jgi:hypothetical protein
MSDKPKFYDRINVYEFSCELPGSDQKVIFKPVNTGQLKKLLTYENETNLLIQEQALDDLLISSVLSEDFDVNELYLEDRFFLLVELRKKTKGEVLEFTLTCPKCNSQSINRVDLNSMPVKPLDTEVDLTVELVNDVKVYLRRMKRKHQKEINPSLLKSNLTNLQIAAQMQTLYHACAIDKIETPDGIDENLNMNDKIYLIDNIPTSEYDKIRNKIEEVSFGLDLTYKASCRQCDYKAETIVPVESNFFS